MCSSCIKYDVRAFNDIVSNDIKHIVIPRARIYIVLAIKIILYIRRIHQKDPGSETFGFLLIVFPYGFENIRILFIWIAQIIRGILQYLKDQVFSVNRRFYQACLLYTSDAADD